MEELKRGLWQVRLGFKSLSCYAQSIQWQKVKEQAELQCSAYLETPEDPEYTVEDPTVFIFKK